MLFKYHVKNQSGTDSYGEVEGVSENEVLNKLHKQGLIVISLEKLIPNSRMSEKNHMVKFIFLTVGIFMIGSAPLYFMLRSKGTNNRSVQDVSKKGNPVINIEKNKFEGVYRAAKTIASAANVGVNFMKFNELLQNFETELSILKDKKLTGEEEKISELYGQASKMYEDSLTLWDAMIKYDVDNPSRMDYADMKVLLALRPLLAQYGIELKMDERLSKFMNFSFYILPKNSLQLIWSKAQEEIDQANRFLHQE